MHLHGHACESSQYAKQIQVQQMVNMACPTLLHANQLAGDQLQNCEKSKFPNIFGPGYKIVLFSINIF